MASNFQAVSAYNFRDSIKESLEDAEIALKLAQERCVGLREMVSLGEQTTEVFSGVALSVVDDHVSAVDWSIGRWASVYEHVQKPGTWMVAAHTRGWNYRLLDEVFSAREDAMLAAKKFVVGI